MIKSMTGYGKGRGEADGVAVSVEIRSVNHRYGDISVKLPRNLLGYEAEIKKRVAERLKRGKIDIFISQDHSDTVASVPVLNRSLAAAYMDVFSQAAREFAVTGEVPLMLLMNQRDVVTIQEAEVAGETMRPVLEKALDQALTMLEAMRRVEGEATSADFEQRLSALEDLLGRVEKRAPRVPLEWQARLKERLERHAQDFAAAPERIAQELAIFADRCDISEEIARFQSHLGQFRSLFNVGEPVGRQMDFIVQEMNREANTMGSKSNDAELTRMVVSIKSELEKVREQVQNVE